jgi:hypothetical protein
MITLITGILNNESFSVLARCYMKSIATLPLNIQSNSIALNSTLFIYELLDIYSNETALALSFSYTNDLVLLLYNPLSFDYLILLL